MTNYGSNQGRYARGATRASQGRFPYPEKKPRRETPDQPDITSLPLTPTGHETKAFIVYGYPEADMTNDDCICIGRGGIYIPKDHRLSTVAAVEIIVREKKIKTPPKAAKGAPKKAPARRTAPHDPITGATKRPRKVA